MSVFVGEAKIYALIDNNQEVFYIGCTIQPVETRVAGHVYEAMKNLPYTNLLKNLRIKNSGYKISHRVLETKVVKGKDAASARRKAELLESRWIKKCLEIGYELTNRVYANTDYSKGSKERIRKLVKIKQR